MEMQNVKLKTIKLKSFALIIMALLLASLTVTAVIIVPVKAQTSGISIGPPILAYTGGPVPSGVTPQVYGSPNGSLP